MQLTSIEESLLVATYFRGRWASNSDQILTLSLFYSGNMSYEECGVRFSTRGYVGGLYRDDGRLDENVAARYKVLINMLQKDRTLIEGTGDFETPADPTFTSCRLTDTGLKLVLTLIDRFPSKPAFPAWPDSRSVPRA